MQAFPLTNMQSHIDSIHSPQRTRNTIIKLTEKISIKSIFGKLECYTCAWNLWSSILAWHSRPNNKHGLHNPFQITASPSQRKWRWWYRGRRSDLRVPRQCSSWLSGCHWETSMTWPVWTHEVDGRIWASRDQRHPPPTTPPMTRQQWGNQNNSTHPDNESLISTKLN